MSKKIEDTFFLSSDEALRTALLENKFLIAGVENTQICYHCEKYIENAPYNCIYIPLEGIADYFAETSTRFPSDLNSTGTDYSKEELQEIFQYINKALNDGKTREIIRTNDLASKVMQLKPDFQDEKIRIFLPACRNTLVLKNVSASIAREFEKYDEFDVKYFVVGSNIEECASYNILKEAYSFNPHVYFSVNHLQRNILRENDNRISFTWIQDRVESLYDDKFVFLEKKEHIYTLLPEFSKLLDKKNIPNELQSFCVNDALFFQNENIQREKKIVFIGSSYGSKIGNRIPHEMMTELVESFMNGSLSKDSVRNEIIEKYIDKNNNLALESVEFIVRDLSVLWLCSIQSDYKVEIYGKDWEHYAEVRPFYKGIVEYGEELANIYNSATYTLAPHSLYILQQRTLEAAACGCIPIVYDIRDFVEETYYDEAVEYFKTQEDLVNLLSREDIPKKDFSRLLKDNSYATFVKKMVDVIHQEVESVR